MTVTTSVGEGGEVSRDDIEAKLREMRGDELRKMNQSGMLALVFAHLFSLGQIRDLFGRQVQQGKGPAALPQGFQPAAVQA